jgi:glycosyltransferase involved in cell wall biosynthesis
MKVALLGPYPPDGHLAGGVDAVVWALAEGLAARPAKSPQGAESPQGAKSPQGEVELHVLTAAAGLEMPVVSRSRPGLTLHQVPLRRGDRLLWHWPFVRSLIRTLQAVAPDVVHAHGTGPYAAAALGCGRPAVITPHGVIFREAALAPRWGSRWAGVELPPIQLPLIQLAARLRWMFDAWYERWIVRRARDLIAISPYVVQEYRPLTRARFHTIENPVADVFFDIPLAGQELAPRTSEPGAAETERGRMLCVARLIPRKDILTLLHAFARVRAAVPGTRLEIAGQTDADTSTPLSTSPPYTRACLATVAELGLEGSVHFLGEQHGAALVDCYARADLVLLTSRQETAPVVVAEAMAAGRPVVATRVGGVPYMVADGQTGLLADAGDPQGLADATIALLSQPERRRAYGEAGRKAAWQRFRLEAVVQRTVELYASMLATNRSRRLPASGGGCPWRI